MSSTGKTWSDPLSTQASNLLERFLALSERRRGAVLALAAFLTLLIALIDWRVAPNVALGSLYIVPILLAASSLKSWQIAAAAVSCSFLREIFGPFDWRPDSAARLVLGTAAFFLAGQFVAELDRRRVQAIRHIQELQRQTRLRIDAEQRVQVLVQTSPLAILTLDSGGRISLANLAAHGLLGVEEHTLPGQDIRPYLPILTRPLRTQPPPGGLRTNVECRGYRKSGEVFLAHIWLSTYETSTGPGLAAVVWDASENLRDREGANLDSMLATSRILIGAVSHEVRNLAAAAVSAHQELARLPGVGAAEQYQALRVIIRALEKIASSGLRMASDRTKTAAELSSVLDEARIVIEPMAREGDVTLNWRTANDFSLVQGDQHSLLQVFLNLARNSHEAMAGCPLRELSVEASRERDLVVVRFRDTGCGVRNPEELFRPLQSGGQSTGLGLFVSRAILRSYGGDLRLEQQAQGSCFVVELWPVEDETGG